MWTAIASIALGAYQSRRASKENRAQSEFEAVIGKEMVPLSGFEQRRTLQFQSDLMDRDRQRERQRRRDGFAGLARNMGTAGADWQPPSIQVPDIPDNPVPDDEVYRRVSGLSNPGGG
jgi:hypothetical protein